MAELPLDRDGRILSLMPLCRYIASELYQSFGGSIEYEDLLQDAHIGAIDAVSRFDESLGYTLGTFAGRRIRGAIIDGVRERDVLSRSYRLKLVSAGQPTPTTVSLDREVAGIQGANSPGSLGDMLPDDAADRSFEQIEICDAIRRVVAKLPERMRFVVIQYYWEERTLLSIGAELGVTESRASQILSKAKDWLHVALGDTFLELGENEDRELVIALA